MGAAIDGYWRWELPTAPDGTRPLVNWHAVGSAPGGDVYVGGMDHRTNAALYRLRSGDDDFVCVGDARSASLAAGNWRPGETAEKFHTRPTWHRGRIYVATMDYSHLDHGYLDRRGFHWYAYDPAADTFADVSVSEPDGVGAAHLGLVAITSDPERDRIYGAAVPTGEMVAYDPLRRETTLLGRPTAFDRPYLYHTRYLWLDGAGRLYFGVGNSGWGAYDPAIYGHLYRWSAADGFEALPDFRLQSTRATELGRCVAGGAICWVSDDEGCVYRFERDRPSWTFVGRVVTGTRVWTFQVDDDGRRAWVVTTPESELWEYDLRTFVARRLCALRDLDPALPAAAWNSGYDSWDDRGRFFFASAIPSDAPEYGSRNLAVIAIDPIRLTSALGAAR